MAVASPVKVRDEKAPEARADDSLPPPPQPAGSAPEAQVQQTIAHDDRELDAQRRYLVALKKVIKAKLVYPANAGGVTGAPVVMFKLRADGSIEPDSLAIRRTSGYGVLDEQALHAVRNAAPFEPPPKAMLIALEMPFFKDNL